MTPREHRIPMQLRVEVLGADGEGNPFALTTFTVDISRYGARLAGLAAVKNIGDTLELRRGKDRARFRVVWTGQEGTELEGDVGLRTLEPAKNIWGVPLPPAGPEPLPEEQLPAAEPPPPAEVSFSPRLSSEESPEWIAPTPVPRRRSVYALLLVALLAVIALVLYFARSSAPPSLPQRQPAAAEPSLPPASPTPESEAASPPVSAPASPAPAPAFAVQVGAFESRATAEEFAQRLETRYQHQALVDVVELRGKTLYRVRLVADTEEAAHALVTRLHREERLNAWVTRLE